MRVSGDRNDPGYRVDAVFWTPYLDGVRLTNCVTADEEQGIVLCWPDNEGKEPFVKLVEKHGQVDVIPPHWLREELGYGTA